MERVLVIGAPGNVAREVIRHLQNKKAEVVVALRNPGQAKALDTSGMPTTTLDYTRPDTMQQALTGVDRIFLGTPARYHEAVERSATIVKTAKEAGVKQIVFCSVLRAEESNVSAHRIVEQTVQGSGIPYAILRTNLYMQFFDAVYGDYIKKEAAICVPAGKAKTSFIDLRDLAAVAATVLTEPGYEDRILTLTGARALGHDEVAMILSDVLGKEITYTEPSSHEFAAAMKRAGFSRDFVEVLVLLYYIVQQGWTEQVATDATTILRRPLIPFEQYAREYAWAWK